MPQYRSPGVYVEEIDAGPKPIEGVSTSICGAIGMTALGPTSGKPELVTSFAEFTRKFGGFLPLPDAATQAKWADPNDGGYWWQFPLAVKAFFDNGGEQIYIKRVFAKGALASLGTFGQGLAAGLKSDAVLNATELKLTHLIGLSKASQIQIFKGDDGSQVGGNFVIDAIDYTLGSVTLTGGVPAALSAKRGDFVQIKTLSASPVTAAEKTLKFTAKAKGKWGDDLSVRVQPVVGGTYNILFDPVVASNPPASTDVVAVTIDPGPPVVSKVEVTSTVGFTAGDQITIGGITYAITAVDVTVRGSARRSISAASTCTRCRPAAA